MFVGSRSVVALLSGGLDSSVAMALAIESGMEIKLALTFDYGQRASKRETECARKMALFYKVPHQVLPLPWFSTFENCGALLSPSKLPKPSLFDLDDLVASGISAKAVWVPNRNGVFIEIAASFAESGEADAVVTGFNREEAKTFPDNSTDYMNSINKALSYSTSNHVVVVSPTAQLTKNEIVEKAQAIGFPFHLVWSCYESGTKMCGLCESCLRLKRALAFNGVDAHEQFECADEP